MARSRRDGCSPAVDREGRGPLDAESRTDRNRVRVYARRGSIQDGVCRRDTAWLASTLLLLGRSHGERAYRLHTAPCVDGSPPP